MQGLMTCEVTLLSHTAEPARTVAAAARLCYSPASAGKLFQGLDAGKIRSFLAQLRRAGHFSPFEHASFTLGLEGLSRVASHQLVRHRLASFSQQSQRYVEVQTPDCVVPPRVAQDPQSLGLFEEHARRSLEVYDALLERGIPKEDARFVLPHGWTTQLVVTMNARELHHFFRLRLCRRAQWEIREVARAMLLRVREAAPELFDLAGPDCVTEGVCREPSSCGAPYSDMEGLLQS